MSQIWPKRAILNFPKNTKTSFFRLPKTRRSTKNYQILMNGLRKKCEKPPFLGKTGIFFKKALGTIFSRLKALTNSKVSEKSNERFSINCVTDKQTNRRDSLGLKRLRRETKKTLQKIIMTAL